MPPADMFPEWLITCYRPQESADNVFQPRAQARVAERGEHVEPARASGFRNRCTACRQRIWGDWDQV
jgi:hypothetical protein